LKERKNKKNREKTRHNSQLDTYVCLYIFLELRFFVSLFEIKKKQEIQTENKGKNSEAAVVIS
jgi:hypothetical protein